MKTGGNEYSAKMIAIRSLMDLAFEEYNELKDKLMKKRIRFKSIDFEQDDYPEVLIEGTVHYMSFYDYELTISVIDSTGQEHFLHDEQFEVLE